MYADTRQYDPDLAPIYILTLLCRYFFFIPIRKEVCVFLYVCVCLFVCLCLCICMCIKACFNLRLHLFGRMKLRALLNVTEDLQNLGLSKFFTRREADFSGVNGVMNLHMADVFQVTELHINEGKMNIMHTGAFSRGKAHTLITTEGITFPSSWYSFHLPP